VRRIRSINAWSTGDLLPDLSVVAAAADEVDDPVRTALLDAADEDLDRCVVCPEAVPEVLPAEVENRLRRLIESRASALAASEPKSNSDPKPGPVEKVDR
jgi:hypothetical protein